jgi:predicted permease
MNYCIVKWKRENKNQYTMDKFSIILNSIDWVFAGVILIGGRYWGTKYFRLSKRDSLNFLGFATAFSVVYLAIIYFTQGIGNQVANLFITYLVVTSFYELIAQRIFEWIEGLFGKKKETPISEAVAKYEAVTGETVTEDKKLIKP